MNESFKPYEPHLDRINDAEQMRRQHEEHLRQEQARLRQQEAERLRLLQEQQRQSPNRP